MLPEVRTRFLLYGVCVFFFLLSSIHIENPTKMQHCIKILFHIYVKLNICRATHRPSSGA